MTVTLAIPSKGRLKDQSLEILARAGLAVSLPGDDRKYGARIEGRDDVAVAFLSASEISGEIGLGSVDLGITGEDLVREMIPSADAKVILVDGLGFGHANVVVAVPQAWIDVRTMADLEDVAAAFHARRGQRMRVATKYVNLTRRFFAQMGVSSFTMTASST